MKKKIIKDVMKICTFIALVNLPFITVTQLIGIDTFLDSFNNPDSYQYFKSSKLDLETINTGYIVLQKSSHPDFFINPGDTIFYLKDEGGLMCREIHHINKHDSIRRYYTINFDDEINDETICEYQIIGKVVSVIENNIWNKFSLEIWDASINNLNAAALFTN